MLTKFEFIFHVIISSIILPFVLFASIPLFLFRQFVRLLLFWYHGNEVSLVSGRDMVNGLEIPECRSIINVLLVFEGKFSSEKLCDSLQQMVISNDYPKARQYVERKFGFWCWINDNEPYDWRKHVKYIDENGVNEQEFFEILDKVAYQPFRTKTPMWEVIVIPKFNAKFSDDIVDKYCLLIRMHHFMTDGVNLVHSFLSLSGDNQYTLLPDNLKSPTILQKFLSIIIATSFSLIACNRYFKTKDENFLHGPKLSGNKIMAWSEPMELNTIKKICCDTGYCVTDILIGSLASSLSKYINRAKNTSQLSSLRTVVTIAFPPTIGKAELKNNVSFIDFDLPISNSNLYLLQDVSKQMNSLRKSPSFMTNYWLLGYLSNLYPDVIANRLFRGDNYSLLLSNVPGPTALVTVWGQKVLDTMFWLPNRGTIGISISILSYRGRIRAALTVDKTLINNRADVEMILQQWTKEINCCNNYDSVKDRNMNNVYLKYG